MYIYIHSYDLNIYHFSIFFTYLKPISLVSYLYFSHYRVLASTKGLFSNRGRSDYQENYTVKPIVLRKKRPTSDNRKNNPHPCHLSHLRRLCNEVAQHQLKFCMTHRRRSHRGGGGETWSGIN